jgi:hypothetical protein
MGSVVKHNMLKCDSSAQKILNYSDKTKGNTINNCDFFFNSKFLYGMTTVITRPGHQET